MTTTEYLQREIRRTELSVRRAERKPNTPPEELRGLHENLEHLQVALEQLRGMDGSQHGGTMAKEAAGAELAPGRGTQR